MHQWDSHESHITFRDSMLHKVAIENEACACLYCPCGQRLLFVYRSNFERSVKDAQNIV